MRTKTEPPPDVPVKRRTGPSFDSPVGRRRAYVRRAYHAVELRTRELPKTRTCTQTPVYTAISKQDSTPMSIVGRRRGKDRRGNGDKRVQEKARKRERKTGSPDETNSKRDVLLIILTPGVRLNERRSQTREARCKFNYREEESAEGRARGEREVKKGYEVERRGGEDRQLNCRLYVCYKERERERESVVEVEKSSSIYMMAVCLGRLLMGRKRVVVIKGTRDSIQWHTERPSRMRLNKLSRITADVFLVSDSSVISYSFLGPPYPSFLSVLSPSL